MNTEAIHNLAVKRVNTPNWTGMTVKELVEAERVSANDAADKLTQALTEEDFASFDVNVDGGGLMEAYARFNDACLDVLVFGELPA